MDGAIDREPGGVRRGKKSIDGRKSARFIEQLPRLAQGHQTWKS
jgi:hypothetical protein